MWHPSLGKDPEQFSEDELVERLRRLPYGGCSIQAADAGGMYDAEIAELLGMTRHNVEQIDGLARFRVAALRLGIDFR